MNWETLQKHVRVYAPVLSLERIINHDTRRRFILWFMTGIMILLAFFLFIDKDQMPRLLGLLAVFSSLWLILHAWEAFYYSYYFRSLSYELEKSSDMPVSFEVAEVFLYADQNNITQFFVETQIGRSILYRLGISDETVKKFLHSRKNPLTSRKFVMETKITDGVVNLDDLVRSILHADDEFALFLQSQGANEEECAGASAFVENMMLRNKKQERWWSRDSLGRIKGIGKHWSYGRTEKLERYSSDLSEMSSSGSHYARMYEKEIDAIEGLLARAKEANAMLVTDYGPQRMSILSGLQYRIDNGSVLAPLEHKRIIVISSEAVLRATDTPHDFERLIVGMLVEAAKAGNVILVIDDLPALIVGAKAINVSLSTLIDPFISGTAIQMIAITDRASFERIIRSDEQLSTRFEIVYGSPADTARLVQYLQSVIPELESKTGIFFTFQSIRTLVTSADRYFADSSFEDKVNDLLLDIVTKKEKEKNPIVVSSDITALVTDKTGVPVGMPTDSERAKLLSLEPEFGKRVVGQKQAILSLSDALRRTRASVSNTKRPIGSFLFVGPTGVGKTETTKALAELMFGSQDQIMRLDMSEYNTPDALNRLIGSLGGDVGTLPKMLREKPYGVLLLDEFEKTEPRVKDLFLQILDEGIFSDAMGKKVNTRNTIIIATSNAGSALIWEKMRDGSGGATRDEVIDKIVRDGIMKPELINRFDAVILFNPLSETDCKQIGELMLKKLKKRLLEQGIDFVISSELIDLLAKKGSDPEFGARPLNRFIQDTIEPYIARRILEGTLKPGERVEVNVSELS